MKTYTTSQGDTFDLVAFKTLGSCDYTEALINANREQIQTFIFSAGVELTVPDIEEQKQVTTMPPWRR